MARVVINNIERAGEETQLTQFNQITEKVKQKVQKEETERRNPTQPNKIATEK